MNRDNQLFQEADAWVREHEKPETWPQITAAIVACVGLVIACFFVLHIIP